MTPPRARRTPKAPNRFSSDMSISDNIDQSTNSNDSNLDGGLSKPGPCLIGKIKLRPIIREPLKVKLPKLRRLQTVQQTRDKQPAPKPANVDVKIHKIKLPSFAKKTNPVIERARPAVVSADKNVTTGSISPGTIKQPTSQSTHFITSPSKSNSTDDNLQPPLHMDQKAKSQNDTFNTSLSTDANSSSKGNTSFSSDDRDPSDMQIITEKVNTQQNEDGIRCPCGVNDDIGVMVECEKCSNWQHGHCINVGREEDAYEGYVCAFCVSPQANVYDSLSQLTVGDKLLAFFDELESVLRATRDDASEVESHVIKGRCALLTAEDLMEGIHDLSRVMRSLKAKWALLTSQKYETELRIWQNPYWAGKVSEIRTDANSKTFYFIDRCKANLVMNIRNMMEKLDFRSKVFQLAIESRNLVDDFKTASLKGSINKELHSSCSIVRELQFELEEYKRRLKDYLQQN